MSIYSEGLNWEAVREMFGYLFSNAYSEPSRTSTMEVFVKIVNTYSFSLILLNKYCLT